MNEIELISCSVPDERVVDDGEYDEDGVHGGERDQEHVERVVHVRLREDDHTMNEKEDRWRLKDNIFKLDFLFRVHFFCHRVNKRVWGMFVFNFGSIPKLSR